MKDVKVLVSSCACNQKFLALVEKVVKENGIDAKVSAVSDIMEQMQYNVMSLPALVVDGKVVARGQKSEKELIQLLTQLLPFELFSKKFCLNISELGFEIV